MKKFLTIVFVIGFVAALVQAGTAHYIFDETSSGTWEVSVTVTGSDTAGLATYDFYVLDITGVSYVENTLYDTATSKGFDDLIAGYNEPGTEYWVDNYQWADSVITGIGKVAVSHGDVNLGVPAVLGTLSTPAGLGEYDFDVNYTGLLNAAGDAFLDDGNVAVNYEVNPLPLPEPMTLSLLAIGGAIVAIRRKRSV